MPTTILACYPLATQPGQYLSTTGWLNFATGKYVNIQGTMQVPGNAPQGLHHAVWGHYSLIYGVGISVPKCIAPPGGGISGGLIALLVFAVVLMAAVLFVMNKNRTFPGRHTGTG